MRCLRGNFAVSNAAAVLLSFTGLAGAAQIWVTGVLEENPAKYSRCVAVSEDGHWVVGNSRTTDPATQFLIDAPFYWSTTTGMRPLTTTSGNSYVTGCATRWDGSLLACGNVGGLGRKWENGAWHILPAGGTRSVYGISHDSYVHETWIVGSSYPAENEKAYRYRGSNNSYIDFWGYYQDAYSVARNGWAVGKNNWGNGQTNPDWRYDHAIFIFNWNENCSGGGNCGWDQLRRFAGYGDSNYFKSRATAINGSATWAVGYQTYNPADLGLYHAFKWQVPANPTLAPEPGLFWARPIDLGVLGAGESQSYAYCVSDNASNPVIGGTSYGMFKYAGYKAVFWNNSGVHDLHAVLENAGLDMSRWAYLNRVTGITADGNIMVGYGMYDDDDNPGTPAVEMGFVVDLVNTDPQPPIITLHPADQYRCYGGSATFTAGATGGGSLSYRWQKNQANLADGGHYSGTGTSMLVISNADASDLAGYRCVVTNAYGSATSNEAALTLASGSPATPLDGIPVATASDKITWAWADVAGEAGYRVKDTFGLAKSSDLAANATSWQETNLAANTSYQRRVHAFNACGESAGSAGQARYTLALPPTYGTGTGSPTVSSDKGFSIAGLAANASISFTATNGFGGGPAKVGQFGYLWNQTPGNPSSWTGEQFWTSGTLVRQVGASGNWYLHIRSYNNDSPKAPAATVLNLGPYTVGGTTGANCLSNPGFEDGFTNGVGNGWTKFTYSGNVTCLASPAQYHSGSYSQAIYSASAGNEGGVYQQFATTPGEVYTVRVWVKCSGSNISAYLGIDPLGGTNPLSSSVIWLSAPYTSWGQKYWTGPAQAGKMTVYLDAGSTTSSSGTVWLDDLEPACSSTPDTLADGVPVALSTTAIRWTWADVANETGYRVIATDGTVLSGDLPANTVSWDETTGIAPNTQYTRKVVAFSAGGESGPSAGQTRYSFIETPTGATFANVTTTSVDATATGSLSNLTSGSSGVRVSNTTDATNSGWQTVQAAWTADNLQPNTAYSFVARARNGEGVETVDSAAAQVWTRSLPPTVESVTADKAQACVEATISWQAVGGFGTGQVQYYRYAWNQEADYVFMSDEPVWNTGALQTMATTVGNWYLHVRSYNGADVPNGSFSYPLVVQAATLGDLDADCDVDGDDLAIFMACSTGPQVLYDSQTLPDEVCPLSPDQAGRIAADLDRDGDVDQTDFGYFQRCITSGEVTTAPNCLIGG